MFNDWDAADLLLIDLDGALAGDPMSAEVLFIDDGSTLPMQETFARRHFMALQAVDILQLRRNLGHQRAIAVGLVYIYENIPCSAVVVMDADGEDRPADIRALGEKFDQENQRSIIFSARAKRLERPLFRFLYPVYRLVHWLLTRDPVPVAHSHILPFHSL